MKEWERCVREKERKRENKKIKGAGKVKEKEGRGGGNMSTGEELHHKKVSSALK
jgi:hypothetical protein